MLCPQALQPPGAAGPRRPVRRRRRRGSEELPRGDETRRTGSVPASPGSAPRRSVSLHPIIIIVIVTDRTYFSPYRALMHLFVMLLIFHSMPGRALARMPRLSSIQKWRILCPRDRRHKLWAAFRGFLKTLKTGPSLCPHKVGHFYILCYSLTPLGGEPGGHHDRRHREGRTPRAGGASEAGSGNARPLEGGWGGHRGW